jgi:hypothetical protein
MLESAEGSPPQAKKTFDPYEDEDDMPFENDFVAGAADAAGAADETPAVPHFATSEAAGALLATAQFEPFLASAVATVATPSEPSHQTEWDDHVQVLPDAAIAPSALVDEATVTVATAATTVTPRLDPATDRWVTSVESDYKGSALDLSVRTPWRLFHCLMQCLFA